MTKPVVGVIGNAHRVENRFSTQMVGERNLRAIADVTGALPLMFAGTPEITDIDTLLGAVDGILLTGARANVHPTRFGLEAHPRYEPYDSDRDELALALVHSCVERGVPLFGMVLEGLPAAVVLIPVVFPIAEAMGIDPIHFNIVQTAAVGIGLFLPPMGVGLLMALRFANLSVGQHFRTYIPYMLALFAGLILIICIPEISLTLPRLAGLIR